jgi:predicted sulfurtransferase
MKKVSLLLVVSALLISGNVLAAEGVPGPKKKSESKICTQIEGLLEINRFDFQNDSDLTAFVRFTVNSENEIVVLSVETEDERLEGYVKARLNYNKVTDQNVRVGRIYQVPIRITA